MCEETTLVPMPSWARANFKVWHPEYGVDGQGRQCFRIDTCIVSALEAVWAAGFKTLGCCCGHGQGYGVISLDLGMFERDDWKKLIGDHHCSLCGKPCAAGSASKTTREEGAGSSAGERRVGSTPIMKGKPLRAEAVGSNPTPRPRATPDELHTAWLRGYTAALAALAQFGQDTIYDEVVTSGEPHALLIQARRDGALRWSGLTGYHRRAAGRRTS